MCVWFKGSKVNRWVVSIIIMITLVNEEHRSYRKQSAFDQAYRQLNEFIDKLDQKIVNRLQLVQQTYLDDFKTQHSQMQEELRQLRANLDSEMVQQRANQKMFLLEEERDFFRAQVLKLNQEITQYVDENKRLKKRVADIEIETANYKAISVNYEKKIMRLQHELTQVANFKRQNSVPVLPQQKITRLPSQEEQDDASSHQRETITSQVNFLQRRPSQTVRTKTFSKFQSATKASMRRYQQQNQKEQMIDECIKEVKKEIFFRTHDHQKGLPVAFEDFGKVGFDKFTRTDRKQLVQALLSNQKILQDFNEFLITRTSHSNTASRMLKTKIGDDKFNEKFLSDLKRSFNRKMQDLKSSDRKKN